MIGAWSRADGSAPTAGDADDALFQMNLLVSRWNARDLALHAITRATYTWPVSTSSRTVGPSGADLTGTRPLQVLAAKVIPTGQTNESPVRILTHIREYAAIANKAQTGARILELLYEPTGQASGTLTVWPVPTAASTLILHHKSLLAAIALADEITVPDVYRAALISQTAKRCAPLFVKSWTREMQEIATEDWAEVQRANIRVPDETCMPAGIPGRRGGSVSPTAYDAGLV